MLNEKNERVNIFVSIISNYKLEDVSKMSWPSGLRRNVKAVVFIGVGSKPTDIMVSFFKGHYVSL